MSTTQTAATVVKTAQTTVERSPEQILSLLSFNESGDVTFSKGANLTVEEIASTSLHLAKQSASVGIRSANVLRISRGLPDVTVQVGGGAKELKNVTVPAFRRACELVRHSMTTDSQFQNVLSIVELLDIKDANGLTCSPFVVKETLGYLRKTGVLDKDTLKLKGTDSVAKALKDKSQAKVNAIREVVTAAKEKRPDLFPPSKSKSTPLVTFKGQSGPAPEPTTPAAPKADPQTVARDLKTARGHWEAIMAESKSPDATRKALLDACRSELDILAKLAGLTLK